MDEIDYDAIIAASILFDLECASRSKELREKRNALEEERSTLQKQINKINSEINGLEEEYEAWLCEELKKREQRPF